MKKLLAMSFALGWPLTGLAQPEVEPLSPQYAAVTRGGSDPYEAELPPAAEPAPGDWTAYGHSNSATRYSSLDQINRDNVGQLELSWEFQTGDMPADENENSWAPETTPLKIGGSLYLCSATNVLIALDAASGREDWRYDPEVSEDNIPYSASCRGVAYHRAESIDEQEACHERIIQATLDARLIAVDAATGVPCEDFGNGGHVDLLVGMGETVPGYVAVTSPPTIVRGIAVVGHQVLDGQKEDAPSGVIRGYDAVTGELAWAWDMENPGETGLPDDGLYTRGTPNAWTTFSGDEELGLVYIPMGNSSVDYYGANRTEREIEFSTALVALDVTSGEVSWVFQTVHYDVWDYDLGGQGTLVDFPMEGGNTVPAVIVPTKQGDIYVLDRASGEPLTEVEERSVPQSSLPDDSLSPTQPFSVGMPSLAKPPLEEKDMWGISPIDQLWCRIQFRRANYEGMYTPPSAERPWIQYPGYNGGNDWGGATLDEGKGILILNYTDFPMYNQLVPRRDADEQGLAALGEPGGSASPGGTVPQAGAPYAAAIQPWRNFTGVPCKSPPWGGMMAIDLESRSVLWDVPLGTARANGPFGIPSMLPVTIGTPNNGGSAATASGLIFIAATTDNLIRAMDVDTGEVLWEDSLPAGGQATPIVYETGGRQYLVIMAGGHHFMETPIGDYVIAYALPE